MLQRSLKFFLFVCLVVSGVLAQDLASLQVTVADPTAAMVPGAKVSLVSISRGTAFQGETNRSGFVSFDPVPAGAYTLEIDKPGFGKYRIGELILTARDRRTLRAELQIAAAAGASVNVSALAEAMSADAASGTSVDQKFVENLPMNGRNAESLILMAPGITSVSGSATSGFNANGLRTNTNYFTLDGVSVNQSVNASGGGRGGRGGFGGDEGGGFGGAAAGVGASTELINVDALQEMRIQTSSFAPEFGRTPGAQIVMTSRGGSNSWHGSVYDYLRRTQFNANDWFANANGFSRGKLSQDRPGGTFGGAIKKDRTFFFAAFEQLKLVAPYSVVAAVPDRATRAAAPAALAPFLNAFPLPNGAALLNNAAQFRAVVSNPANSKSGSVRIDHIWNARTTLFARYSVVPTDSQQRGSDVSTPNVLTSNDSRSQTATAGVTRTLRNGGVNDLRLNYSRFTSNASAIMDSFGGAIPLNPALVYPKQVTPSIASFNLNIQGVAGYSIGSASGANQTQINIVDGYTKTSGAHTFKVGGDVRELLATNIRKPYTESVSFNGIGTEFTNGLLNAAALNARIATNSTSVYPTYRNYSAYAQDTWRLSQWTTLTYGVRWDVNPAPIARSGPAPFALSPSTIAGVTQNDPIYQTRWYNFAPRIGVSDLMDDRPGKELVFRAGFGLFYDLGYGVTSGAFTGAPYSNIQTYSNVKFPLNAVQLVPPGLPATRPYGQVLAADTNLLAPKIWQWNLGLERNFGVGQTVTITYVATKGTDLSRIETRPAFSSAYNILTVATNGALSNYQGLQLQFRRRMAGSLQVQVSYTYAHSIDSASSDVGGGGFASLFSSGDRASSDYDIRHNLSASGSYRLPSPGKAKILAPFRDWYFDFVGSLRTGLPFTIQGVSNSTSGSTTAVTTSGSVTTTTTNSNGLFALVRPNYWGGPVWIADPTVPGGQRISSVAFAAPLTFSQGNLGRNVLRGFGANQIDLALRKTIIVTERVRVSLAMNAFNVLNHPNFANVSPFTGGNMASPTFGIVSSMLDQSFGGGVNSLYRMGGPRTIEFSIRVQF